MLTQPPSLDRIYDCLAYNADLLSDETAISFKSDETSYEELKCQVDVYATALLAAGICPGDRVGVLSSPTPEHFVIFLSAAAIGAIYVGLNPRYMHDELAYVIDDCAPKILFSRLQIGSRKYESDLRNLVRRMDNKLSIVAICDPVPPNAGVIAFAEFLDGAEDSPEFTPHKNGEADAVLIIYTSGTTGRPKGAMLTEKGILRHSRLSFVGESLSALRSINCFPVNHVAGLVAGSLALMVNGGMIVYVEKFDPEIILETLVDKEITFWGGVPTMFSTVFGEINFSFEKIPSVELISWGGGAAPASLVEKIASAGIKMRTHYTMTETAGSVTMISSHDEVEALCHSVGAPLDDVEWKIINPDGGQVSSEEEGELCIRGDFIMAGYYNRPEATKSAIDRNGWLHTADLAKLRADGRLELLGRKSDMYKSGGFNVYPREVELALETHPNVRLAVVVGRPDGTYGEVGVAFVRIADGREVTTQQLVDYCRSRIANYKIPKAIKITPEIPVLANGKPDKVKLKKIAAEMQTMQAAS